MTPTLATLLRLPVLRSARLLTREGDALSRHVTGVSVIEVPVEQFVRRGELVLSTGMGVGGDEALLGGFVEDVAASGASALVVSLGPHTADIPAPLVERAERGDLPLLTLPWEVRFSDVIGDVLRRLIEAQGVLRWRDELVWSLANGTLASEAWGLAQGQRFGFDLTRRHFALVGQREPRDDLGPDEGDARSMLDGVLRRLARGGHPAFGAPAGESVVLFVQDEGDDPRRWVEDALVPQGEARTAAWSWGMSTGVRGALRFRQAYGEARVALQVGRSVQGPGRVTSPAEVLGGRVLLEAARSPAGRDLQDRLERALIGLSSRSGAAAWRTLEVYVETGGNVSEGARRLGVHRQSLLHRLERLQGALGWDLGKPEDRFTLELAVRLRRLARLTDPEP